MRERRHRRQRRTMGVGRVLPAAGNLLTWRGGRPTHLVVLPLGCCIARRRLTHRGGPAAADVVGIRVTRERRKPGLFVVCVCSFAYAPPLTSSHV